MQKIFIKYVAVIMTAAIFLILFINGLFNSHTMRNQQYKTFQAKIDQMIHTLENNRMELALLNENLDADYLTRARAAAYVMDRQEDVLMDVMYEIPSDDNIAECVLTKDVVEGKGKPRIVYRNRLLRAE